MPSGIYKRTKEHCQKIKEGAKKVKRPKTFSKKAKKNLSISMTKQWKEGKRIPGRIGTHLSPEHKKKLNDSVRGKKNPNYIHGKSKDPKYRSWIKNKRNKKKRYAEGSHTFGEWELLKKQYGYICPCCKKQEPFNQRIKCLTEDHIIPLSKGGSDYIENIQPLCMHCNLVKHTEIIKY